MGSQVLPNSPLKRQKDGLLWMFFCDRVLNFGDINLFELTKAVAKKIRGKQKISVEMFLSIYILYSLRNCKNIFFNYLIKYI